MQEVKSISILKSSQSDLNYIIEWVKKSHGYSISMKDAFAFAIHTSHFRLSQIDIDRVFNKKKLTYPLERVSIPVDKNIADKFYDIIKASGELYSDPAFLSSAIVSYRVVTLPKPYIKKMKRKYISLANPQDKLRYKSKMLKIMDEAKALFNE